MTDLYSLKNDELELGAIIEMFDQRWVKASEHPCNNQEWVNTISGEWFSFEALREYLFDYFDTRLDRSAGESGWLFNQYLTNSCNVTLEGEK